MPCDPNLRNTGALERIGHSPSASSLDQDSTLLWQPPELSQIGIRVVGLPDRYYEARLAILKRWFPHASTHVFDDCDTQVLSQANRSLDVLVIHGREIERIGHILREWKSILPSKLIIAVIETDSPQKRCKLFDNGADMVLGIDTPDVVIPVWLGSILGRTAHNKTVAVKPDLGKAAFNRPYLTSVERTLLKTLLSSEDVPVRYSQILSAIGKCENDDGLRSLRIAIWRLRKKIGDSIKIQSVRGLGYGASWRPTKTG